MTVLFVGMTSCIKRNDTGGTVGALPRRTGGGNVESDGLDLDERWLHLNQLGRHSDTGVGGGVSTGVDHDQLGGDGDTSGTLREEAWPASGITKLSAPAMQPWVHAASDLPKPSPSIVRGTQRLIAWSRSNDKQYYCLVIH